jgi:hypothetical protein
MRLFVWVSLLPFLVAAGGRSFHHDAMKVRGFEAPLGWEPQQTGSYPRLLAQWETKDGGRMTLVAQKVRGNLDAQGLAAESKPALERQGFRGISISAERPSGDESDRVRLDAMVDDGHRFVRQLYVVADGIGYVLTMTGPLARAPQMRRDFEEAATSLSVGD